MNLLDIVGPVMVGPSSSHTAGAVKIGNVCRRLFGEDIVKTEIFFHGSFHDTGKGHGTDRAIVAGLLGMEVDDIDIPHSFEIAKKRNMEFTISPIDFGDVHPNSAKIIMYGAGGRKMEVLGASVGGGRIEICEIDDVEVSFDAENPTLIIHNVDEPGFVAEITPILWEEKVNIANMRLHRKKRGTTAVMVIECDQEISENCYQRIKKLTKVLEVTYLGMGK